MATKEQLDANKEIEDKKARLRGSWRDISESLAVQDLLNWLDGQQDLDYQAAAAEMDNMGKKGLQLQSSTTYGKVGVRIRKAIADALNN